MIPHDMTEEEYGDFSVLNAKTNEYNKTYNDVKNQIETIPSYFSEGMSFQKANYILMKKFKLHIYESNKVLQVLLDIGYIGLGDRMRISFKKENSVCY